MGRFHAVSLADRLQQGLEVTYWSPTKEDNCKELLPGNTKTIVRGGSIASSVVLPAVDLAIDRVYSVAVAGENCEVSIYSHGGINCLTTITGSYSAVILWADGQNWHRIEATCLGD